MLFAYLDEIPESKLREEIERREAARKSKRCDYCFRKRGSDPPCKYRDRHEGEVT